jgi:hypothetical protein
MSQPNFCILWKCTKDIIVKKKLKKKKKKVNGFLLGFPITNWIAGQPSFFYRIIPGQFSPYFCWNLARPWPRITRVIGQTCWAGPGFKIMISWVLWFHYLDHRFCMLTYYDSSFITQLICLSSNLGLTQAGLFVSFSSNYILPKVFFLGYMVI